jgi:hypothetical protein
MTMLARRVSISVTLAIATATAANACHDSPAKPKFDTGAAVDTEYTVQSLGLEFPVFYVGQQQGFLVIAKSVNNDAVPGVAVTATPTAGSGTLVDSSVVTDSTGKAVFTWNTPTKSGNSTISFSGTLGGHTATRDETFSVFAGPAVRVEVSTDTVRFTNSGIRSVPLKAYDQYENRAGVTVTRTTTTAITASVSGDSLLISSGHALDTTGISISSPSAELARVPVVAALVVKTLTLTGVADSANGIGVGEAKKFGFSPLDSGGALIVMSAAAAGIQFSSSDTSLATVAPDGTITGRTAPGTAKITAVADAQQLSVNLDVFKTYDFGPMSVLYSLPAPSDCCGGSAVFSAAGPSIKVFTHAAAHGIGTYGKELTWYSSNGALIKTSPTLNYSAAVVPDLDGGAVMSWPLTRYDSTGNEKWSKAISGYSAAVDSTTVVLATSTSIDAFNLDGTPQWSYPVNDAFQVQLSKSTVSFHVGSTLQSLNRAGAWQWSVPSPGQGVVDENGVYFSRQVNTANVTVIGIDGVVKWTLPISFTPPSFAFAPNNELVFSGKNKLQWLDRATGTERLSVVTPWSEGRPVFVIGSRVYLSAGSGVINDPKYLHVYDVATGAYLGRTISRVMYENWTPVCTKLGLAIATLTQVARFAKCE